MANTFRDPARAVAKKIQSASACYDDGLNLSTLANLRDARDELDRLIEYVVADAREAAEATGWDDRRGLTWDKIGWALGMTKQGAQQRYGD